jgi:hypothetical protein
VNTWKTGPILKAGETYVVISKNDGVVYKRIGNKFKDNKKLKLVSDNPVYEPYEINGEDVLEIWKAKAYISTHCHNLHLSQLWKASLI